MLMLGLNETIDQFAVANSVGLYGHVEARGWSFLENGIRF